MDIDLPNSGSSLLTQLMIPGEGPSSSMQDKQQGETLFKRMAMSLEERLGLPGDAGKTLKGKKRRATSVDAEWLFSFSARTIMKLRNQLSEKSAHSAMMVGQWASDLDLIAVDEFESQLVEGWTCKKKRRAPASAEAQGSSTVIVVEDNSS
ncbi:hypothetical protein B0H14DRAFT_2618253 [Mycena olivaceomarginata]|nr:hypothetical protein B0H14DRAFT_2618247 [Mycena olivaceomarginata]KAJ7798056.1 hypothetical protein B0H14DRAFT_2618253 [Mycena olivaceomarginata]